MRSLMLAAILGLLAALSVECGWAAEPGRLPWKAGDPPPPIAGVRLGDARDAVERTLGKPGKVDELGDDGWQLTYDALGLEIAGTAARGVESLLVGKRNAGDLGGFRVGDHESEVLQRWGPPDTGGLGALVYYVGPWQLAVQEDAQGHIVVLGLALRLDYESTPPEPAPTAAPAAPPAPTVPPASFRLPPEKSITLGQALDLPPGALEVFSAQYVGQQRDPGERLAIRIAGIVAPTPQLPGWEPAQARLAELLKDKPVHIEITCVTQVETVRLLTGRVLVGGQDVAPQLIREGWALACRERCEDRALMALEAEARAAKRGLWGMTSQISSGSPEAMMGFLLYGCQCARGR